MANASYGLFFREGSIIGNGIAQEAIKDKKNYFEICKKKMIEKKWVEDVKFEPGNHTIRTKGSIEVGKSEVHTCHRLRGMLCKMFEIYLGRKVHCREIECESTGAPNCVFKLETTGVWD
ncbi:MAG: V4R domain-containing protein [Thermoplasmata archaeon]